MSQPEKNPVINTLFGVKVRRYNYLSIMYPQEQFEELIRQAHSTGLSIPVLIALKSQPCQQCKCDNVTLVIAKDGKSNKLNTSQNIIEKNAERHAGTQQDQQA